MSNRSVVLYFSWSRPGETGAPLGVIENRFPSLFESRRLRYPKLQELADPARFDQGIAGFLDHIQKPNFVAFAAQAANQTGRPVLTAERIADDRGCTPLDGTLLKGADTLIVISFDSLRTEQKPAFEEVEAVRRFLDHPDHLMFVCPHHDIGHVADQATEAGRGQQLAEFLHHGDRSIPPQQGFGGFGRALLAGLGIPVENRYGLRPLLESDGTPAPIEVETELDSLRLLSGVPTLNLHSHLPHFERLGDAVHKVDVLARQKIDPTAPPHPFTRGGRKTFDALLQSRPGVFPGRVLMSDATLFSSTAGGVESLQRLWTNIIQRPRLS
jgi:hypothetical protein